MCSSVCGRFGSRSLLSAATLQRLSRPLWRAGFHWVGVGPKGCRLLDGPPCSSRSVLLPLAVCVTRSSASVIEVVTVLCFLAVQSTGPLNSRNNCPSELLPDYLHAMHLQRLGTYRSLCQVQISYPETVCRRDIGLIDRLVFDVQAMDSSWNCSIWLQHAMHLLVC